MTFLALYPLTAPLAAAVSFLVTLVLTPALLTFAVRLRLFDPPGPLKIHSRPIPRIGGVAVVLGFLAGILISPVARNALPGYALACLLILFFAGLVDDLRGVPIPIRLAAQLAAALLICRAGYALPFAPAGWLGFLALVFFSLVAFNAFNFLDGSDGLASGITFVIAIGFAAAFCLTRQPLSLGSVIAASLAAACAAFLIFNFPPARIFLGDSGSTFLGFAFVWLAVEFSRSTAGAIFPANSALFPLFVGLLPLLDFFFAMYRRVRRRASPFSGDRSHFYDGFLTLGWTPRRVAVASSAVTLALSAIGCAASRASFGFAAGMLLCCVLLLAGIAVRLGAARSTD